ncbi:propionyl-CoA carboxylase-like protein [Polychaeton citri CBS 116435]|uniref:Propionyl-CoA carboxylase-like protein n=1 Tax=Polychaeton citri CBS 116435 TaxID=1314669 RepID=A0A9P4ULG9_9PEZI|nr:propionyl-CoA carboxylase-like protein [Polychaeton citri CBS 116435]
MASTKKPDSNCSARDSTPQTAQARAASRAAQLSEHLSTQQENDRRRKNERRTKPIPNGLPADYSDILGQVASLRAMANTPDPSRPGYVRQKQAGKLWVRERVDKLLDPGSFYEVGSVSGEVEWKQLGGLQEEPTSFTPSNNVQGFGKLLGREIVFTADDFSLRAGHADGALMAKTTYMEKLALKLQLPMIKLVDGSSGGGSVTTIKRNGWSYIPPLEGFNLVVEQLNSGIPNLGACLGPAIGLGAARVVACHFSVMAADIGALFNAGPNVVKNATFEEGLRFQELGGPYMHGTNGTIDNIAANEEDSFEQIRKVLSFLPNSGTQIPPSLPSDDAVDRDCPELRTIVPRRRERMYNARKVINSVVDKDSFFEIGPLWGRTVIVGLARLGGYSVGICSNNPEISTGSLDAAGSQKLTRHLKFCDLFNIPLMQFVDVPGYTIGTVAERAATMRWGVELAKTYYTTTMPIFSVVVRKAYGVAGGIMLDCRDPRMRVAWPSGEWGSLPLDGGIEVGHSAELKKVEQEKGVEARKARYIELEQEYRRLMNPVRTANAFGIEEIIDPAVTRPVAAKWLERVYKTELPERIVRRINGQLRPVFA